MSSVGFRIRSSFERPDKALVGAFRGIPVANIADCMNRIACVDSCIYPMNSAPLLGCAYTVKVTGGDNLMIHKALDLASPGDVIVVAGGGTLERAYSGELMVQYAISRGLAGLIVDGCMRDRDAIALLDFPVYCKGITPNGPFKNGPGEIGYPVSFAGQVIFPGDIVVGDGDGIVVIRPNEAAAIAEEACGVIVKEEQIIADIKAGKGFSRPWMDKALNEKGCVVE